MSDVICVNCGGGLCILTARSALMETWLKSRGVLPADLSDHAQERRRTYGIIDLPQGRLLQSVFLRHCNRPNFKDEIAKARTIIGHKFLTA